MSRGKRGEKARGHLVNFAAFEHERSVNLLEFEVSKEGGEGGVKTC